MSNISEKTSRSDLRSAEAARNNVAVFDLSDRTQIEIAGSDRVRFLQSFTSNDIKKLKPGKGCETFVTNLKGKVVGHVFVFCSDQSLWLDGTQGQQDAIIKHLGKFLLIDDVQLIPRGDERGELFVTGPLASQLLQLEGELGLCDHVTRENAGESFDIRRVDLLGTPGFLLSIPSSRIESVKLSLCGLGVAEGTRELFETLRIEAGYPRYGVDISDDNLAQEVARTKQCISFDKGCYLGQETIARLDSLGHTNREFRRLRFETNNVPVTGSLIYNGAGDAEVGVITSAANDLTTNEPNGAVGVIALGLIKRDAIRADTPVTLRIGETSISGRVL